MKERPAKIIITWNCFPKMEPFSKDNMSDRDLNTVELLNLSGSEYARDREGSEYV